MYSFQGLSTKEKEFLQSSLWGSFFVDSVPTTSQNATGDSHDATSVENGGKSTEQKDTLWGHFVKKFSTIAVPTVEHVAGKCQGYRGNVM